MVSAFAQTNGDGPLAKIGESAFQSSTHLDTWNDVARHQSNLWSFYVERSQTHTEIWQYRPFAREHVLSFEYKAPLDGKLGSRNLWMLSHGAELFVHKQVFQNHNVRRHHVRHDVYRWTASVMNEGNENCSPEITDGLEF